MDPAEPFQSTVGAACSGDRNAYESLFGRNLPVLVAYLRSRIGGAMAKAESAEDLAQSVCREVLCDLPELEFRREDQFRAYLFLQARRKVLDRARYYQLPEGPSPEYCLRVYRTEYEANGGVDDYKIMGRRIASDISRSAASCASRCSRMTLSAASASCRCRACIKARCSASEAAYR